MESVEKIISYYVLGLNQFNLNDEVERYGLVRNFKYDFRSVLINKKNVINDINFTILKNAYLEPNQDNVVDYLIQLNKLNMSNQQ